MRHESSTVICVVGEEPGGLLADVGHSPNVCVIRPAAEPDPLDAAGEALRAASRKLAPFVLVAADPLAQVAETWRAMWSPAATGGAAAAFEARAAEALAAWRAERFELPDYYLVLSAAGSGEADPGLHLGPLRASRPRRVDAVVTAVAGDHADAGELTARVLAGLRALRHGPWWPPLDELMDVARRFHAGGLAEGGPASAATVGSPATTPAAGAGRRAGTGSRSRGRT